MIEHGPFVLIADVRLDNRVELASELDIPRETLGKYSDSRILFEALLKWGRDAPQQLVGEFAFALWNSETQNLLLGRDIFGFRPLHFYRCEKFIALATMPSGLHAIAAIPREVDVDFVIDSLALIPHTGTHTYFRHIERVEPAHIVEISGTDIVRTRYWRPNRATVKASPGEFEAGLRDVLSLAVKSQLRGAGSVLASHLSSGLDSAIVTGTAARLFNPGKVVALTAVPRADFDGPVPHGRLANEGALAATTSRLHPNVTHIEISPEGASPLEALDREHYFQQQPIANLCNATWGRRINEAAKAEGATVLLTGSAGNMSISYSGLEAFAELIGNGNLLAALRLARKAANNGVSWLTIAGSAFGPYLPRSLWSFAKRITGRNFKLADYSSVNPERISSLEHKAKASGFDFAYRPRRSAFDVRTWSLARTDGGQYFKGVLAEWGLSVRDPTADRRVVEYCLSVPAEEFIRDGVPRSLARRAFLDRISTEVAENPLSGYQSADWYEAMEQDISTIRAEADAIASSSLASQAIDGPWLKDSLKSWPPWDLASERTVTRYRWGALRALAAGHFIRKVAGEN